MLINYIKNMIFTTCGTIKNGVNEFANVLYNKIINLSEEGIETTIPYKTELDQIYESAKDAKTPNVSSELLTTSLYFFYIDKVYHGLETAKSDEMEWFHEKSNLILLIPIL
jgi:hypothetical protein